MNANDRNDTFRNTLGILAQMRRSSRAAHARRDARAERVKVNAAAAKAKQIQADADFAEYLEAGFSADELKDEFPGAHSRHLNAIWRAKQGF